MITPLMKENLIKLRKNVINNSALVECHYICTLIDVSMNESNDFSIDLSAEKEGGFRTFTGFNDTIFKENLLHAGEPNYNNIKFNEEDLSILKQVYSELAEIKNSLNLGYITIRLAEYNKEDHIIARGKSIKFGKFSTDDLEIFNLIGKVNHQRVMEVEGL